MSAATDARPGAGVVIRFAIVSPHDETPDGVVYLERVRMASTGWFVSSTSVRAHALCFDTDTEANHLAALLGTRWRVEKLSRAVLMTI